MRKKILIVKLGALGDIMFSTPLIRTLKKGFPQSSISYLTTRWSKDIIECNPYLYEVLVFENMLRTILKIRKEKFDVAFILHRTILSNLFVFLCNIPERIGFKYQPCSETLVSRIKGSGLFLTKKVFFDKNKHEIDRYLDLASACGINADGTDTEIKVPDELKKYGEDLLSGFNISQDDFKIGILAGGGINPGTTMSIKRLDENKIASVADTLIEKFAAKVIFVGDEKDFDYVNKITGFMKHKPVNLVGMTGKKQLLGVLSRFNLFIAGDSGSLHISAGIGIPTIGIFGPSDPRLVAPRGEKHTYVWRHVKCSPCYNPESVWQNKDFSVCPSGTLECMKSITADDILSAVEKLGVGHPTGTQRSWVRDICR